MSDFLNEFLSPPGEGQIELPSGEGFAQGFIGPVTAAVMWSFWSAEQIDLQDWLEGEEGRVGFSVRGKPSSWFYYFRESLYAEACAAAEYVGQQFKPGRVWRFEVPTAQVVNFAVGNAEEKWGATISGDVNIRTLGSAKYRHEFHMMALPAAVGALAVRVGYVQEPMVFFDEILNAGTYDDEFQVAQIGSGKKYTDSALWAQRANLWAALGEDNAAAFNPIGTGSKYDTTSEKLSKLLGIVTRPWVKPVWGRLVLVPDPRAGATYGEEAKRLSVPCLTTIYADEGAARAAAAAELEEVGITPGGEQESEGGLAVPAEWVGYKADWIATLKSKKEAAGGKLPPPPARPKLAEELSTTVADLEAWWDQV